MKVEYTPYGFSFTSEDGRDELWLAKLLVSIPKSARPYMSNYIRVDMEDSCVKPLDDNDINGDTMKMKDCDIEECIETEKNGDEFTWGGIASVEFCTMGYYIDPEAKERIKKLSETT